MKKIYTDILRFFLFAGIGLVVLYFVYQNQSASYQAQCALDGVPAEKCSLVDKIVTDFQQANWAWISLVWVAFFLSNVSRAMRWQMLIKPLGYTTKFSNGLWSILLGYFANLGLPRMGELVRASAMSKYEKVPLEKLIGTVVVDRLADFATLLLIIGVTFLVEFETLWGYIFKMTGNNSGDHSAKIGMLILVLVMIAAFFIGRKMLPKVRNYGIVIKVEKILVGFLEGFSTIRNLDNPIGFMLHSLFIWLMYYLMLYFCFLAYAPTAHLGLGATLMVFVFGTFGMIIPSPGGMGTYHALVVAGLAIYGVAGQDAFSLANIAFFTTQIFFCFVFGILALIVMPMLNKNYKITTES
jgi:uncharacterized protein (TIRG00374 family)